MPLEIFTIINDNKLIGTIKLDSKTVQAMKETPNAGILLTREVVRGDAPLLKFGLTFIDVRNTQL